MSVEKHGEKNILFYLLHIKKGWTSKTICVNSADTNENHYYLEHVC